jgi:hypothetical protein
MAATTPTSLQRVHASSASARTASPTGPSVRAVRLANSVDAVPSTAIPAIDASRPIQRSTMTSITAVILRPAPIAAIVSAT